MQENIQPTAKRAKQITLSDYLKGHPNFKNLTHDKIQIFRRYIEQNPRGKFLKQTKYIGKSFIEKCPDYLLDELVVRIYNQFRDYLLGQKKTDDEKLKKIGELLRPSDNEELWRGGIDSFCQREKERAKEYRRR